jgi:hypothetical protein
MNGRLAITDKVKDEAKMLKQKFFQTERYKKKNL